jgi:DNA-binding transcriptional LysR family regulator
MRRRLPSTAALATFEAAARHQSFTKAADELAVTQSAVCRQIASLEGFLALKLFRRSRRGVTLTEAGAAYARQVGARLDEVERDAFELMARGGGGGALDLAVVPTFATRWLLPRLGGFLRTHPGIDVHLTPRTRPFLFDDTPFHAAIHAGAMTWPGTEGLFLMREDLIAVASPALIAPRRALRAVDVAALPLLQQSTRPYAWRQWFATQGVQAAGDLAGPRMELFSMLAEAAIQGLGVALIPRLLVEDELARGQLAQCVDHRHLSDRSYYLIVPERRSDNPLLKGFRAWLDAEARAYRVPRELDLASG